MDLLPLGPAQTGVLMQWHSMPGKDWEQLPCLPLDALLLSSLKTEPKTTTHVFTELGFLVGEFLSQGSTHILWDSSVWKQAEGRLFGQKQRPPLNPTTPQPYGVSLQGEDWASCAPASVLAVLKGAGAAGSHFILQSSFISRELTWGFKTLSN